MTIAGLVLLACFGGLTCRIADTTLRAAGILPGSTPTPTATLIPSDTSTITPPLPSTAAASATLSPTPVASDTPRPRDTPAPTMGATATPAATQAPSPTSTVTFTPVPPASVGEVIEIHFIDVGQGDAILIRGADAAVLIDGGERGSGVVAYIKRIGVQRLDVLVATHPHADHIGGLTDVLQALPVAEVITNGQPHTTLTYERFLDAIIAAGAEYREVTRGEQIQVEGLTFHVLHPTSPSGTNLNEQSVVLRLDHHRISVLLTGDIESNSEASLVTSGQKLQAQILKVPHHGSSSSNTQAFLQQVRPEIAIYFAGAGNRYGHPHAETISGLKAMGVEVYGTDVNGTVVVTTDGQTYQVTAARAAEISVHTTPTRPSATAVPPPATAVVATTAPEPGPPTAAPEPVEACPYIGNANTGVFHQAGCYHISRMAEHNKVCLRSRDDAIARGYRPCGTCKP